MEVSKSSASNIVSKTAEKGLLKTKAFPKDGRVCMLELTDKGKKVVEIEYWADMRFFEMILEIWINKNLKFWRESLRKLLPGLMRKKYDR